MRMSPKVASAKAKATAGEPEILKLAEAPDRILPISASAKSDAVKDAPDVTELFQSVKRGRKD